MRWEPKHLSVNIKDWTLHTIQDLINTAQDRPWQVDGPATRCVYPLCFNDTPVMSVYSQLGVNHPKHNEKQNQLAQGRIKAILWLFHTIVNILLIEVRKKNLLSRSSCIFRKGRKQGIYTDWRRQTMSLSEKTNKKERRNEWMADS